MEECEKSKIGPMPGMTINSKSSLPDTPIDGSSESAFQTQNEPQHDSYSSSDSDSKSESDSDLPSDSESNTDSKSNSETESKKDYSLEEADQSNVKHGRGPSRILKAWGTTTKMNLVANEHNEIIGDNVAKFSTQLGAIARDGNKLPLTYTDWRALSQTKKDRVWMDIKANTNLDDSFKSYIMKRPNKHWREWKQTIKKKYYLPFRKDKEMLATCPDPRIEKEQWQILVNYWQLEVVKKRSKRNKKNRKKQSMGHTTGRKGLARLKEELRVEKGAPPSKLDVFVRSRTRKNGQPIDKDSAIKIASLKEKVDNLLESSKLDNVILDGIHDEAFGKEKPSHIRTFGSGPTPAQVYESVSQQSAAQIKAFEDEVNAHVNLRLAEIEENMRAEMEKKINNFKREWIADLETMRAHVKSCPILHPAYQVPESSSSHQLGYSKHGTRQNQSQSQMSCNPSSSNQVV